MYWWWICYILPDVEMLHPVHELKSNGPRTYRVARARYLPILEGALSCLVMIAASVAYSWRHRLSPRPLCYCLGVEVWNCQWELSTAVCEVVSPLLWLHASCHQCRNQVRSHVATPATGKQNPCAACVIRVRVPLPTGSLRCS